MITKLIKVLLEPFRPASKPRPKRRVRSKYKIEEHPKHGFVAFFNTAPGRDHERWWSPIDKDMRPGSSSDQYLAGPYRKDYFVKTEEEAGQRVNEHATRGGMKQIWPG